MELVTKLDVFHSVVLGKIYLYNIVKNNYFLFNLLTVRLILDS